MPALLILSVTAAPPKQTKQTPRTWTTESAKQVQDLLYRFYDAFSKQDLRKAIELGEELRKRDDDPKDRYGLACAYALSGRPEDALHAIEEAIECAPNDISFRLSEYLRNDDDIASLRSHKRFPALLIRAEAADWRPMPLTFESGPATPRQFVRSRPENTYLTKLRIDYNLNALVAGSRGDMERVKILCTWVHTRWNHVGDAANQPEDPIGLLEAAKKGDNFRCVEYGVTVAGCLNAVGIPARVVRARAKDVETRRFSAGHVFAEAYLRDQKRWVFIDPQMNVVGEADGVPLNTVEFRQAFSDPHPKVSYNLELGSCFYYFDYGQDLRYPLSDRKKGNILLGPKGSLAPKAFQRIPQEAPTIFTHNPADVYAAPPEPTE